MRIFFTILGYSRKELGWLDFLKTSVRVGVLRRFDLTVQVDCSEWEILLTRFRFCIFLPNVLRNSIGKGQATGG